MTQESARDLVRNITTLGHVDHGKTTFVDSLLAANNIISARMAGKIRYMDSREDEQQRGITMESSAVSLRFKSGASPDGTATPTNYVINLIDTPGHVDFSGEVSSASRLCDGALVLVDVVEGVCTQTVAVLRQAWIDRLRPILVINKFDRLITELKLAPIEAYHHLSQLIEQVNAVMGEFYAGERMENDLRWREERERRIAARKEKEADQTESTTDSEAETSFQERDDEDLYFGPERGNVIFASALDGWGFRIGKFAQLYATRLGIKENNFRKVLWGDYYLDPKTKRVISYKHLRGRNLKPLFVQFVLENIWAIYENVVVNPNSEKVAKIVSTLNLKILPRDLKSKETRHLLSLIFTQWLPLSTCTVQAVVDIVPPPALAQRIRIPKMLYPDLSELTVEPKDKLEEDLFACNAAPDAYVCAYVSKMFAVSRKDLPENRRKALTAQELRDRARTTPTPITDSTSTSTGEEEAPVTDSPDEVLIGFARLYSGILRVNTTIICILPKYNSALGASHPRNARHMCTAKVTALYTMMGRELVPVDSVVAGSLFAIAGLEGKVWRSATLCSPSESGLQDQSLVDHGCLLNLGGINTQTAPIVRVALETNEPAEMPQLIQGLKLLSQTDPCVETFQQQTGEYVILTAGELHLERCLKDLRERFAKVEIQASKPIVPFRETAIKAPEMAAPKTAGAARGTVHGTSPHGAVGFTIRAVPLPDKITSFLQSNISILKGFQRDKINSRHEGQLDGAIDGEEEEIRGQTDGEVIQKSTVRPGEFWTSLKTICEAAGSDWKDVCESIWAFGPHRVGANLLIDRTPSKKSLMTPASLLEHQPTAPAARFLRDFEDSIETGFQIATFQGPLCAEPVQGLAYFVELITVYEPILQGDGAQSKIAQVSGSLISIVKDACRTALLDWSPRLMLAMYTCDIQASTDVLGKVYGVVARRRGRIVSEEIKEGTTFFTIKALLPVIESFGFADELRTRTSGAASPQLIFSGYEILDEDPFWIPTTEEELEDLGEKSDRANVARGYMDGVRQRKGMFVEKKIVEFAEKQRTLKR